MLQSRLIGKAQCIGSEALCRRRCLIAYRDQLVYAQLPCVTPDFMMKGLTVLPQLKHRAQHQHPVTGLSGQHLQRRVDRRRVGVVAVINDCAAAGQLTDGAATSARANGLNGTRCIARCDAHLDRDGQRCECIFDVLLTRELQADCDRARRGQ